MVAVVGLVITTGVFAVASPAVSGAAPKSSHTPSATGELDCNGFSPVQKPVRQSMACTDIRGQAGVANSNTWGGRFYDNGHYIGHDEPDMTFYSTATGSGNDVTWTETLGADPAAAPTVHHPGRDVSHWFELSPAPWFSMAMCDSASYPQAPCTPKSDSNSPGCAGPGCTSGGRGSAFMEMQFYPPGFAPFDDADSCDNTHWCAALTIDSLECTAAFAVCNPNCEEPVNFAFIQTNGVPTGPASPQKSDLKTFTPNGNTLLMNPGDNISVHMSDAQVPGAKRGVKAFEVRIDDLSTGQSGYMQASAANGFMDTTGGIVSSSSGPAPGDCSGTAHNFQPEYDTASQGNIIPWAALATDISTEFETGHFEPCTQVLEPATIALSATVTDTYWNECKGPYEAKATKDGKHGNPDLSDAYCYPAGDTHGALQTA
ncbi:MAG: hypothetical protein ACRDWW_05920, partial [Acidimicrobiales bacterium]